MGSYLISMLAIFQGVVTAKKAKESKGALQGWPADAVFQAPSSDAGKLARKARALCRRRTSSQGIAACTSFSPAAMNVVSS